jgi:glycolate oxidase FAD binding subunit
VGLDGLPEQVQWQAEELGRLLAATGLVESRVLDGDARDGLWRARGELPRRVFAGPAAVMTWGVLPSQVADVAAAGRAAAEAEGLQSAFAAHAGVGIVSAMLSVGGADADRVAGVLGTWRGIVTAHGGHALLEVAPLAIKERVAVWDPPGAAHRIMKRIKDELDPRGILNPGRFVGGI